MFFSSSPLALAYADDLVIQDNGSVLLLVTDNVLGESTTKEADKNTHPPENKHPTPASPPPSNPAPPAPTKGNAVPLVNSTTPSTVHIDPTPTNSKQINVTITPNTGTAANAGQSGSPANLPNQAHEPTGKIPTGESSSGKTPQVQALPAAAANGVAPAFTIKKTVNQVIAQGANGQPVFAITPGSQGKNVTIAQGTTQAATSLPLSIDTRSKSISASVGSREIRLAVLPAEAVIDVTAKNLVSGPNVSASIPKPQVTLVQNKGGVVYQIQGERTGKFLGLVAVKTKVTVNLSAQTGLVSGISQSPLFTFFGSLIK